jgi:hypothetical protein
VSAGALATLLALGAFHGLNPAMGWMYAVARGLQERSRARLLAALPAIAAGHAASIGLAAIIIVVTGSIVTSRGVAIGGGVLLVGFGLWRLLSERHFRWAGVRLSLWQLAGWSFLTSSVHGAGLILVPIMTAGMAAHHHAPGGHHHEGPSAGLSAGIGGALAASGVHTLAMLVVAGALAILAYEVVGLAIVRRAWFNLDRVWASALICAGTAAVLTAGPPA